MDIRKDCKKFLQKKKIPPLYSFQKFQFFKTKNLPSIFHHSRIFHRNVSTKSRSGESYSFLRRNMTTMTREIETR